ncbi:MAG: cation:proton antiporter [Desulfarculales bacterium]|jgi:CPA2 family monovalent cation:H+ antiporter-2|nr:cation:proton antiporter [Desulfarculales bacterium]
MVSEIHLALLLIFTCSVFVSSLFQRFKQPALVGYLFTGILIGPHAFRLLGGTEEINHLAEIGVVLLLFIIGMEFSFSDLMKSKKAVLIGGASQMFLTISLSWGTAVLFGFTWQSAVFIGFIICLSSTAIGLSLLQKIGSIESPVGRICLGILIFQDIAVVPLMLLIPWLGGGASEEVNHWLLMAKGGVVIILLVAGWRWIVPFIINKVAASRSQELFIITVVGLCVAVSALTSWAGLSLALGAFAAGMMIAESPYSHQAMGYIIPLRDIFTSLFFVSIGMLLDMSFVFNNLLQVASVTLFILLGKTAIIGLIAFFLRLPPGQSLLAGITLCQIGEFSFVLISASISYNLLPGDYYQLFLAAAVLTMVITPIIFFWIQAHTSHINQQWAKYFRRKPGRANPAEEEAGEGSGPAGELSGHIVIVGFGIMGRLVAGAAKMLNMTYVVVEMNAATVRNEKNKGEPIIYGDAATPAILEHIRIDKASAMVITSTAPALIRRIIVAARAFNPQTYIITRTRFVLEFEELSKLGANEVIPEEFETALEVFSRLLRHMSVPENDISRFVQDLRNRDYEHLLSPLPAAATRVGKYLPDMQFRTLRVEAGSEADGKNLLELRLLPRYKINIISLQRGENNLGQPGADTVLMGNDLVVALGQSENLLSVQQVFTTIRPLPASPEDEEPR